MNISSQQLLRVIKNYQCQKYYTPIFQQNILPNILKLFQDPKYLDFTVGDLYSNQENQLDQPNGTNPPQYRIVNSTPSAINPPDMMTVIRLTDSELNAENAAKTQNQNGSSITEIYSAASIPEPTSSLAGENPLSPEQIYSLISSDDLSVIIISPPQPMEIIHCHREPLNESGESLAL